MQTGHEAHCFVGGTREKVEIKSFVFPRAVALWDAVLHPKCAWPYLLPQVTPTTAPLGTPIFPNHAWGGDYHKAPSIPHFILIHMWRKALLQSLSTPLLSLNSKIQIYSQVRSVRQQQREGKQK